MAFFVTEYKPNNKHNQEELRNLDLHLIAIGKRTNLSFEEINHLRVEDLLYYVRAFLGKEDDAPRKATKKDIDNFFA